MFLQSQRGVISLTSSIRYVLSIATTLEFYAQVSGQTVGSKQTHFLGARQSAAVGRLHFSRIGFSVAADINSNVVDIYFLVWSLSRLLCCVGSGSNVAAALDRAAASIGRLQYTRSGYSVARFC